MRVSWRGQSAPDCSSRVSNPLKKSCGAWRSDLLSWCAPVVPVYRSCTEDWAAGASVLGQKGLFVGLTGPGPMFAAAQYLVLLR